MNYEEIYERIQNAKLKANRTSDRIFFAAVSKTRTVEEMKTAEKIPWVDFFGENRVQEAETKKKSYGACRVPWRLIGHLQNNKVRKAIEIFDTIDSVDSVELAERIDRISGELGKKIPVLIEVNTSGETTKSGIAPENFSELLDFIITRKNLELQGLMTVGPLVDDEREIRNAFANLRGLSDKAKISTGLPLPLLSMGMSDDFELAILEGSTMIRIGTLLFGARIYAR